MMSSYIFEKAREVLRARKKKKIWYRVMTSMAALVVFVTTYMLILPAITMEKELVCGLEEHTHSEECYGVQSRKVLTCDYDTLKVHQHTRECEDENGNLVCRKADYLVHTHDAYCYDANGNLICTLPEIKEHEHEESCYAEPVLACGLVEQDGHVHSDSCYYTEDVLVCGGSTVSGSDGLIIEEPSGEETAHVHTADCWQTNLVLGCTIPESSGHYHSESCYSGGDALICGYDKWEIKSHQHSESCYTEVTERTNELVCGQEEHTHSDNCYEVRKEETQDPRTVPEQTTEMGDAAAEPKPESESEATGTTEKAASEEVTEAAELAEGDLEENTEEQTVSGTEDLTEEAVSGTEALIEEETESETETDSIQILSSTGTVLSGSGAETEKETETESSEMIQLLTCTSEEAGHVHTDACYTEVAESQLVCGLEAHWHEETCYNAAGELICESAEHVHTMACIDTAEESEEETTEAQEAADEWAAALASVELTGDWAYDLLAVAQSQLGYSENTVVLEDGTTAEGYTCYGEWAGNTYGAWNSAFAVYCLAKANVPESGFPRALDLSEWILALQGYELFYKNGSYDARRGDVAFLDLNGDGTVDFVGVVQSISESSVTLIAGDVDGAVQTVTYALDDAGLIGFGEVISVSMFSTLEETGEEIAEETEDNTAAALNLEEVVAGSTEVRYYRNGSSGQEEVTSLQDTDTYHAVLKFTIPAEYIEETDNYVLTLPAAFINSSVESESHCNADISADSQEVSIEVEQKPDESGTYQAVTCTLGLTGTVKKQPGESEATLLGTPLTINAKDLEDAASQLSVSWYVSDEQGNEKEVTYLKYGQAFTAKVNFTIPASVFRADTVMKEYHLTLDSQIVDAVISTADNCSIAEGGLIQVSAGADEGGNYTDVSGTVTVSGTVGAKTDSSTGTLGIAGKTISVYSSETVLTYSPEDESFKVKMTFFDSSKEGYTLKAEQLEMTDENKSNIKEKVGLTVSEGYLYKIGLCDSGGNYQNSSGLKYQIEMTWTEAIFKNITNLDRFAALSFMNEKCQDGSYVDCCEFQYDTSGGIAGVVFSGTYRNSNEFAFVRTDVSDGLTAGDSTLTYNEVSDAFIRDSAYSRYYNSNSPIGTAGSFHIVAFDTANLNTHTNGNVLAKTLNAGSNFGTNGFADELSYIQNYNRINSTSASSAAHVLVVGSSNTIDIVNNGQDFAVNGVKIDKPDHLIQDLDTEAAPFIDLNRVRTEMIQIASNLAGYVETGVEYTGASSSVEYSVLKITNPAGVGVVHYTASELSSELGHYVRIDGFRTGTNGTVVINVDCSGASVINMPKALVCVDGKVQGTSEVVEFSNGKVIWNFLNAEGVTINTQQMTGMIVAPGATVNIQQNLNGTVVADIVNVNAESHRTDFTGKVTEPEGDASGYYITVQKVETGYVGTTLSGAEFDLYIYNNSWQKVNSETLVTDSRGIVRLTEMELDRAYKLVETKAPAGYEDTRKEFPFWVRSFSSVTQPMNPPQNETPDYMDVAEVVDVGAALIAENDRSETTKTTDLTITKEWILSDGGTIPQNYVVIKVYRSVAGSTKEPELYKTLNLTSTLNWQTTLSGLPYQIKNSEGENVEYVYTVEEVSVDGFTTTYSKPVITVNDDGTVSTAIAVTNTQEDKNSYKFTKVDGADTSLKLQGAIFTVYKVTTGEAAEDTAVKTYTTDENGSFTISEEDQNEEGNAVYTKDTLYYVTETKAPEGYAIGAAQKYYFYFASSESEAAPTVPEGGKEAVNLSKTSGSVICENTKLLAFTVRKNWEGYATNVTDSYEVGVRLLKDEEAYEDIVVLNKENEWTYTWSDLPSDSSYTVKEVYVKVAHSGSVLPEENYEVSYSEIENNTITITNTSNTDGYQLPETGGPGTQVYTWGGAVLTALASILMYRKNKRRKEVHRTS